MPFRGIVLIILLAVFVALFYRSEIYSWLKSEFSDFNDTDDNENSKEEQKE